MERLQSFDSPTTSPTNPHDLHSYPPQNQESSYVSHQQLPPERVDHMMSPHTQSLCKDHKTAVCGSSERRTPEPRKLYLNCSPSFGEDVELATGCRIIAWLWMSRLIYPVMLHSCVKKQFIRGMAARHVWICDNLQ